MTTIAVVEDDPGVLDLIKDILEVEGFDVLPYHDGIRALDAFERSSPDLVNTDIAMPEMAGIQLLRADGRERRNGGCANWRRRFYSQAVFASRAGRTGADGFAAISATRERWGSTDRS